MSEKDGYVVVCPGCGKVYNRSIVAESRTKCKRCRTRFYTYLRDGVILTADLDSVARVSKERIKEYTDKLNTLAVSATQR